MDTSRTELVQPITWDPLDLSQDAIPAIKDGANDGPGILPDVTSRPELRPVRAASTEPVGAHAPWE